MNFKSRLARFLYGRYGADRLYNALFLIQIILLFLGAVLHVLGQISVAFSYVAFALYVVAFGLFGWTIFRCFSRNISARQKENQVYLRLMAKLRHPFKKGGAPRDTADHIFRTCPHCKATLRLPRQKGKHTVKCPRCGERFGVKVKK